MIGIRFKNLPEFLNRLEKKVAVMEDAVDKVYRGWCAETLYTIAMETPQWTGTAALNWNVSLDGYDFSVNTDLRDNARTKLISKQWVTNRKGQDPAVRRVMNRAKGTLMAAKITNTIYIANGTTGLDGDMYIGYLEENTNNFLRPANRPGQMLERGVAKARSQGYLNSDKFIRLAAEAGRR